MLLLFRIDKGVNNIHVHICYKRVFLCLYIKLYLPDLFITVMHNL